MRVLLSGVSRHHGAATILSDVSLALPAGARVGVVGPNGVGKSTLLRLIAGIDAPDAGRIDREPATLAVGYLPQEPDPLERRDAARPDRPPHRRRGGRARHGGRRRAARGRRRCRRRRLRRGARPSGRARRRRPRRARRGGRRARSAWASTSPDRSAGLSGGEAARASLASILLSRFDVLALDEPTNDLDFDGLDRLERFLRDFAGGLIVVSHDREFLDRTVERVVAIDPITRQARGVRRRLERLRRAPRRRARSRLGAVRPGRPPAQALHRAARRPAHPGARRRRDDRPARHPRPRRQGAAGEAPPRAGRRCGQAGRALGAAADARPRRARPVPGWRSWPAPSPFSAARGSGRSTSRSPRRAGRDHRPQRQRQDDGAADAARRAGAGGGQPPRRAVDADRRARPGSQRLRQRRVAARDVRRPVAADGRAGRRAAR